MSEELAASVIKALAEMDEGQRQDFFLSLGMHYKTCCGTPRNGWCACFAEE